MYKHGPTEICDCPNPAPGRPYHCFADRCRRPIETSQVGSICGLPDDGHTYCDPAYSIAATPRRPARPAT
jgi:hypothetical protein